MPLPAIGRGADNVAAPATTPADPGLFNAEKNIPDERLGLSGYYPQGSALRRPALTSSGPALTSTSTIGSTVAPAASTGSPRSARYGPGYTQFGTTMAALDTALRGALVEQMQRNTDALQAMRAAPGGSTLPRSEAPAQTPPTSLAAVSPAPAASGALFAATARQQATAGDQTTSPATSSGRPLSAGLRPTSAGANRLSRSTPLLAPRWGATEGGRDALGWVRNLVRFTEAHPLAVSAAGEGNDARSLDVVPDPGGAGFKRTVFPAVKPDRREDAVLLGKWLEDMISALSTHDAGRLATAVSAGVGTGLGSPPPTTGPPATPSSTTAAATSARPGSARVAGAAAAAASTPRVDAAANLALGGAPATVLELVDGVLHVYGVAVEELRRQVGAECRERGELMGVLWDHAASAVALRASLEAEARLGAMQGEYAALLAARDSLAEDVGLLECAAHDADGEAKAAAAAAAYSNRSLAGKLAAAQARAEEVAGAWRVSDMALANEVERRLGLEGELANTRELLRRSDAERLACRVTITKLEEHNASLAQQLADVRKELEVAAAAHAAAHREFEALAAARATQEVDMMRVRHDFETDEILVVSLRQQVRDLEAQLAQLKAFQRDQALALAREVGEKELALGKVKGLGGELEFERARVRELEGQLGETQAKLAETAAALAAKSREYDELAALHEREMAAAKAEIEGLTAEAKQLANRLTDTDTKLMVKERALKEAENELYSLREMLASVATTMHGQGADGVPRQDDKGWGVPGPLGAPQRTIMIASRQLGGLWERLEAMRKENDTLTERLAGEMVMQQKLQEELYASRSEEARLVQARAETEMQLDTANQAKRIMETELERYKQQLKDALDKITYTEELLVRARSEVERLTPLEARCRVLAGQVEDLGEELKGARDAMAAAKQDAAALAAQNKAYVGELDKMLAQNNEMLERVRELTVVQAEAEELKLVRATLNDSVADLSSQLEQALAAHADTLHQLEIARFFLQGLDLVPPQSPLGSTTSMPAHGRPQSAASTTSSIAPDLWRPGTAPAHFPARPTSARPASVRSASASARSRSFSSRSFASRPGTAGAADGDVQILNVSALELVDEEEEEEEEEVSVALPPRGLRSGAPTRSTSRVRLAPSVSNITTQGIVAPGLMGSASARDLLHNSGSMSRSGSMGNANTPAGMLAQLVGSMSRRSVAEGAGPDNRPLSAASMVSGYTEVYGEEVPPEVAAMLHSCGVTNRLHATQTKWMRFKIQLLAFFSNRLRAKLVEEKEKSAKLELELARVQEEALKDAVAREMFIAEELMSGLRGQLDRMRHDTITEVGGLRDLLPAMAQDLASLAHTSTTMGVGLRDLQARLAARKVVSTQTGEPLASNWATFIQSLPREPPVQPLSCSALSEAIVRIYMRALDAGGDPTAAGPAWGAPRHDTVYDAIMDHYTSQRAKGTFSLELLGDVEGPVGRLLRCVRSNVDGSTRIATFASLTGVSPDGTCWAPPTWHFLLHLLHGLRMLLAGTWCTTLRAWAASPQGAALPIQAVYDLVGNLYNVQVPTDLNGMVAKRLATIVTPGAAGPVVDLDALLLLLLSEHNAGACPRAPVLFPRRLTDGALFNIFNALGHSPHTGALGDGRAAIIISTSPPGSPTRKHAQATVAMASKQGGKWPPGSSPRSTSAMQVPVAVPNTAPSMRPLPGMVSVSGSVGGVGDRWQAAAPAEGYPPRTPARPGTALGSSPRNITTPAGTGTGGGNKQQKLFEGPQYLSTRTY